MIENKLNLEEGKIYNIELEMRKENINIQAKYIDRYSSHAWCLSEGKIFAIIKNGQEIKIGEELLVFLTDESKDEKIYRVGKDKIKIKYPTLWLRNSLNGIRAFVDYGTEEKRLKEILMR